MYNYEWIKEQQKTAQKDFENHIATLNDSGNIQFLNWQNKSGSSNYQVQYILNKNIRCRGLYSFIVTGDLGSAIFTFCNENPSFDQIAYFDLEYAVEKMDCSTDKYIYPEKYVSKEVKKHYEGCMPTREDLEDYELFNDEQIEVLLKEKTEDFESLLNEVISSHNLYSGFEPLNCEMFSEYEDMDPEWYEHSFGRCIHPRVILWFEGLKMALEQLEKNGGKSIEE